MKKLFSLVALVVLVAGLAFAGAAGTLDFAESDVQQPDFGSDFSLAKGETAVLGDYKITFREVLIPPQLNCIAISPDAPNSCEPGKIQAIVEVSKKSDSSYVSQKVYLFENSPQSVLGVSMTAKTIGIGSIVLNVVKEPEFPTITANLGESFNLSESQQANVQENGSTVVKLTLERIDALDVQCIKAPCPSITYAVVTASVANAGVNSLKVRLGGSVAVGDFEIGFNDISDNCLGQNCTIGGSFLVKRTSSNPADIYVYLNEPFKLAENQGAIFNQGSFRVDLAGIGYTNVCQGTGCPPSEPFVKIGISTTKEGLVGSALVSELKIGESAEWGDYSITLSAISSDSSSAKFVISSKETPEKVVAYLNEKFKLPIGQKAIVYSQPAKCPEGMACQPEPLVPLLDLKLQNIVQYKCASGEPTAASIESVKCFGSKPVATLDVGNYGENTGTVMTITQGSSSVFGDYEILFVDNSANAGAFLVRKIEGNNYQKVSLGEQFSLKEKEIAVVLNENVYLRVKGILEVVGNSTNCASSTGTNCGGYSQVLYLQVWQKNKAFKEGANIENLLDSYAMVNGDSLSLYGLNISLLKIGTAYASNDKTGTFIVTREQDPKVINVHINESFKLSQEQAARVLEANLRIDVLSLLTVCPTCEGDSTGNVAPSCGGPCVSQVEFSVSNYAFEKAEIGTSVSKEAIQDTAVSSTSVQSDNGVSSKIEIPPMPWRTYTLEAGQSVIVGDFEIQVLSVTSERAEFNVLKKSSGESFSYVLKTGWNLFSMPGTLDSGSSNCESSKFRLFEYSSQTGAFVKITNPVPGHAYWLFNSGKPCEAKATIRQATSLSELPKLDKGWNFIAIVPEMAGMKMADFAECKISSAFFWNASSKKWENAVSRTLNSGDFGNAIAVYAKNACSLSIIEEPTIPPMPPMPPIVVEEEELVTTDATSFQLRVQSHSDGGYSWNVESFDANAVEFLGKETDLSSCPSGIVGCSGFEVFKFRLKSREAHIALKECRPWDCDSTATFKRFKIVLASTGVLQ